VIKRAIVFTISASMCSLQENKVDVMSRTFVEPLQGGSVILVS